MVALVNAKRNEASLKFVKAVHFSAEAKEHCQVRSSKRVILEAAAPMKNARGASYSSTGKVSDWTGPSPAMAKAVRCEANWRASNSSGVLRPTETKSWRTASR